MTGDAVQWMSINSVGRGLLCLAPLVNMSNPTTSCLGSWTNIPDTGLFHFSD